MEIITEDVVYKYLSILFAIIIAILSWIAQRKTERIKIIENQLSDKKYNAYSDLVGLFYAIMQNMKKNKPSDPETMMENMIESKKNIIMYGSDKVVKTFNKWLCSTTKAKSIYQQLDTFLDLMIEMRKDMVGKKSRITKRDLLINLIQDENEADQMWRKLKGN